MKRLMIAVTAVLLGAVLQMQAQTPPAPPSATGTWMLSAETPHGAMDFTLTLKQDADKLTGTFTSQAGDIPIAGEAAKGVLTFKLTKAPENYPALSFRARLKDDGTMTGTMSSDSGDMAFTAKRAK